MKEELKIVYQNYIPDETISGFNQFNLNNLLEIEVISIKEEKKFYNASGIEISDVIIFFNNHLTDLVVGGIGSLGYDVLKSSVKYLWDELKKLNIKTVTSKEEKVKNKVLSLILKFNEKSLQMKFEGEFDTDKIVEKAFDFLKNDNIENLFDNEDYLQKTDKPRIKIIYNPSTDKWEPENYGVYKREFEEYKNSINQRLND